MTDVSGNPDPVVLPPEMMELQALRDEELHADLVPYVEDGEWGPMLRHPLVYCVPLILPGEANKAYAYKQAALERAIAAEDWHTVVFLHERPYRLRALIDYVTGRDPNEDMAVLPIDTADEDTMNLAAQVWIDSENIDQVVEDWRALFNGGEGLWLGDEYETAQFDALPDPIPAYRGGSTGDWSWTTNKATAEFFSRRSGFPVREALIPKADVFGYLLRRSEYELMVRLTDERKPLVYPNLFPET